MPDERRVAGVDALRGIGFLSVFAFHAVLAFNLGDGGWLGDVYSNRFGYFVPNHLGTFGVTLFFVISGYCIHRSTVAWRARHPQATAGAMWRAYGVRRLRRIYPLYLFTLVVFFVAAPRATITDLLLHAGLVQTLVPGHLNAINPSFWSLAVEAQLYALYPLLWAGMARLGARTTLGVAAVFSLAWCIGAPALFHDAWWVSLPWRWGFPWLLGAAIAAAGDRLVAPRTLHLGAAGLIAVAILAPSRSVALYAVVPSLFFAMLVAWTVASDRPFGAVLRPLQWTGGISYALYLIHQPLLDWAGGALAARQVHTVDALPFVLGALGTLALCAVLAAWLERLFLRLVASVFVRYIHRRSDAPAVRRAGPPTTSCPAPARVRRTALPFHVLPARRRLRSGAPRGTRGGIGHAGARTHRPRRPGRRGAVFDGGQGSGRGGHRRCRTDD